MENLVSIQTGPMVGNSLLFVPINFAAALIGLLLIIRIGKGKLNIPIILICLGYIGSALILVLFGIEYLWVTPLFQTLFSALAIISIMKIFGVFSIIFGPNKPVIFTKEGKSSPQNS